MTQLVMNPTEIISGWNSPLKSVVQEAYFILDRLDLVRQLPVYYIKSILEVALATVANVVNERSQVLFYLARKLDLQL